MEAGADWTEIDTVSSSRDEPDDPQPSNSKSSESTPTMPTANSADTDSENAIPDHSSIITDQLDEIQQAIHNNMKKLAANDNDYIEVIESNRQMTLQLAALTEEIRGIKHAMSIADIRKRNEYLRRGIPFPFQPEQVVAKTQLST